MTTYLYFIKGDEVALKDINNTDSDRNNNRLPLNELTDINAMAEQTLPVMADFNHATQMQLTEELVYFDVFDNQQSDKSSTDSLSSIKHAVINANNVNLDKLAQSTDNQSIANPVLSLQPVRTTIGLWQTQQVYNLFKAMQVLRWYQDHNFCSRCGNRTSLHKYELAMVCHTCNYHQYPRLQPCVIVAITRKIEINGQIKKQILLAKDRRFKRDMQSVIAGFVEVGETLEQAVQREVREETALEIKNIRYLGSQPWAFPSNLMIAFHAEYGSGTLKLEDEELIEGSFYDMDTLPSIPPKGSISYEMIMHICTGKEMHI